MRFWSILLNGFFYDPSRMLQLPQFVWTIRSSVIVVFNNLLLIDATNRSKISSDHHRKFFALSLFPYYILRTLPLTLLVSIVVFFYKSFMLLSATETIWGSCLKLTIFMIENNTIFLNVIDQMVYREGPLEATITVPLRPKW